MSVKLLIEHNLVFLSLKGGYTGLSESTLVKMLHCWKSHVTAQICIISFLSMHAQLLRETRGKIWPDLSSISLL